MPKRRSGAAKGRRKQPQRGSRRRWPRIFAFMALVLVAAAFLLIWPFWQLSGQFGAQSGKQPSRLYGKPHMLRVGEVLQGESLGEELTTLGYRQLSDNALLKPGTFRVAEGRVDVFRRQFVAAHGPDGGNLLSVFLARGRISEIRTASGATPSNVLLDPPLIASYYGPDLRERRPVQLDQLPEELIFSVLAAEDAYFLEHRGFSLMGMLRAAWVNLRAKEVRQGGSTLTQQLVKNLYLTHQRTIVRKLREVVLAIFLELRYEKRDILQAYLNEIYWGRSGKVDLMGVGAAAWAYFGKHPSELSLSESALLAGMIQSPANLSPRTHPEAAKERRDFVLGRLAQLKWVATERIEEAGRQGLPAIREPLVIRNAPYFADAMRDEARRRFGIDALDDAGYSLHSTLSASDQAAAEEAVRWGVAELEKGWEKGRKTPRPLESALISVDPRNGAILAYVGGRNYGRSQFDRVSQARRQAGSSFKPIVYATAFSDRRANPATLLEDAPLTVRLADRQWSPKNSDGKYQGWITARSALEKSLNVPTARLAIDVGLERVVETARNMGIQGRLDPYPALALGAMEVAPLEMATVYATFASGGRRPQIHGLEAVRNGGAEAVIGQSLAAPERVLDEDVSFLVTKVLQGVFDRGTGRSARAQGIEGPLAGKTGTTNSRRDSWFAGYSPRRCTLVWVGYDDNSKTRLSGARAALPIWSRFTDQRRPVGGYRDFEKPTGVTLAKVDPTTGGLATDRCPYGVDEYFLSDALPNTLCPQHSGWRSRALEPHENVEPRRKRKALRRWLDMLRGRKKKERDGAN